ncbi:alpha/beta hydrolase family protein [Geodermatophilus sp. URMC 64]
MLLARPSLTDVRALRVRTEDGVTLSGIAVPAAAPARPGARPLTFVVAHGFTNSMARAPFVRPAGWLRRGCDGRRRALPEEPRCPPPLARSRRVPAAGPKDVRDTRPMRRGHWLLETTAGRSHASRLVRLRLDEPWLTPPPAPLQVVSRIAPTPLLLVHGDRDENFPLEHFRTLAQAAGPTATAWVGPGFGHAESGATAPLVERIGRWASATINP